MAADDARVGIARRVLAEFASTARCYRLERFHKAAISALGVGS